MMELLTCARMARCDAWAVRHGVPAEVLMERAGRAVADAVVARWIPRPVLVLCGPGNNGGDGYVAARHLAAAGWPVRVAASAPWQDMKGEARAQAQRWVEVCARAGLNDASTVLALTPAALEGAGLVIDALFGAGLTRPLEESVAVVLAQAARQGVPIVAVDVPSGLHGDTAQAMGAVPAVLTVTFHRKKPGHVLMPGRALCGEVVLADIGIPADALADPDTGPDEGAWENAPALWVDRWPRPDPSGHKYRRGHAVVFGGARMVGASRLSARAAARIGAGLTSLAVPQAVWPVYASAAWSTMVRGLDDGDDALLMRAWREALGTLRWSAVLLGPGAQAGLPGEGGEGGTLRALVLSALGAPGDGPLVLDADALTAFEAAPQALFDAIALHGGPVVLTPHEGEFNRLFGTTPHDKIARTRDAARRSGAVVLHKGPDTVIACPHGRVVVNTQAPPWLATAGSGDVLAGLITGLLAQGMPAMDAASAAAWVHGAAAAGFGPGLVAEDLPEQVPAVLRHLLAGVR